MDELMEDTSGHDRPAKRDVEGTRLSEPPAANGSRQESTFVPASPRTLSTVTPIQCAVGRTPEAEVQTEEQYCRFSGFGIAPGTLELVELQRPRLVNQPSLPLPSDLSRSGPILQEYSRPWRALRLGVHPGLEQDDDLPQNRCLLKNYEPHFQAGSPTFPSIVEILPYLTPRIAVEEASAFVVLPHVRFGLGTVEPLFCLVTVYDISLCCRVAEEFHFTLPGPPQTTTTSADCASFHSSEDLRAALLYILPNHQPQHLYLVLKVAKILSGDGDSATAPYCNPEKMAALPEQLKLVERATDCSLRLGRYRQPLAWGAISLMEGMNRPMTLYRQRTAISDDMRIPMIADAVRGTFKEKIIPATCEFDLKRIDEDHLLKCRFERRRRENPGSTACNDRDAGIPPAFSVVDPFTTSIASVSEQDPQRDAGQVSNDTGVICCREVQPFCHPSMTGVFGSSGSGPVATSYINVLYVYPLRLERFQHRNVAIQVQLLEREIDAIGSVEDTELRHEVLPALYRSDGDGVARSAYTFVSYHQKNPQFENEFKICLPEQLSSTHHVLFTFYHVHCKKLQPTQQQQELVGYAVLPLLGRDGTTLDDANYPLAVFPAPAPAKQPKTTHGMALPPNYVDLAREISELVKGTTFTCRTRVLSSVYSQDKAIAALLSPFHDAAFPSVASPTATTSDAIVAALLGLRHADQVHLRYFLLSVTRFVLGYLRVGPSVVRWAAFRALLAIFEKASWSSHRSLKPQLQEANQILHNYVQMIFDEDLATPMLAVAEEASRPQPLYRALMKEWLHVVQDNDPAEENVETKRVSITFSQILLQLILKSMAITQLSTKRSDVFAVTTIAVVTRTLPQRLVREDDLLIERLVGELMLCACNASLGLLLQKEANQSIAWFCRGLFLVVLNSVPGRVIRRYIELMECNSGDPNTLVHLLFPFLQIVIDFELFAVINGATAPELRQRSISSSSSCKWMFERAWLADAIFRALLRVINEQKELKLSCGAARLIRYLFTAHVYNPQHRSKEEQETIALAYAPFLKALAEFTTDQKLFSGGGPTEVSEKNTDGTPTSQFQLKKELLICVAHLLSTVSSTKLPKFFCDEEETSMTLEPSEGVLNEWRLTSALSPTSALMHYRKVVNERKLGAKSRTELFLLPRIVEADASAGSAHSHVCSPTTSGNDNSTPLAFDEVRTHACFALIRHMVNVFLGDVSASKWLLSPSLLTSEALTSLQELEYQVRHRGSHHRISASATEEAVGAVRRANTQPSSSQNLLASARLSHSGSAPTISSASSGCRTPVQRSMPRNWGKNYASAQQKRGMSDNLSLDAKSASNSSLLLKSGAESLQKAKMPPLEDYEEELYVNNIHRIVAEAALCAIQTSVNQFEHVIRLIEIPFDHQRGRRGNLHRESAATIDQAYALLGSITDLLFFLLWRASKIDCLNGCEDPHTSDSSDDKLDGDQSRGQQPRCFVIELLSYLMISLQRFQTSFFACRVPGLPLIHDEYRVRQLIAIACSAQSAPVRHYGAKLLCHLVTACYDQTGSFQLIKGPILTVLTSVFFPDEDQQPGVQLAPPGLSTEALREFVEDMRQCFTSSERESNSFQIQVMDLLNSLTTQIKVYEMWRGAISDVSAAHDLEEIEDGLFRVFQSLSARWLPRQKQQWLSALLRLHVVRGNFSEAVMCKLQSIQVTRDAASTRDSGSGSSDERIAHDLASARQFAEQANWPRKEVEICEALLALFKKCQRYGDYRSTLRHLDAVIGKLADASKAVACGDDESGRDADYMASACSFYRVKFAGDSVSAHTARNEYIYKRSTFTSLGEFVGEMKAMLRAKHPMCERVDVVPESKPLPTSDEQPNVIFMRVSSVEQVWDAPVAGLPGIGQVPGVMFKFASPFTLSGSKTYGKTSEQMKRLTFLVVAHEFPCMVSRQAVQRRVEIVRCPIETAMDDIRKRCALLRTEVRKEMQGITDLKTLTLMLKGSVDTHVHGGIPEVIESFLSATVEQSVAPDTATAGDRSNSSVGGDSNSTLPSLLAVTGAVMGAEDSLRKRHELANLLVEFAVLCCRCLLISRDTFRRCSTPTSSSAAPAPAAAPGSTSALTASAAVASSAQALLPASASAPLAPESTLAVLASAAKLSQSLSLVAQSAALHPSAATTTSASSEATPADEWLAALLPDCAGSDASPAAESPLQKELERSFAALVQLLHAQIPFPFANARVLPALAQRLERLRMGTLSEAAP